MGWFAGIHGSSPSLRKQLIDLCGGATFEAENDVFFVAAGGHPSTTFFETNADATKGWIACGIGMGRQDIGKGIFRHIDWRAIIQREHTESKRFSNLNGHFAIANCTYGQVELYTDPLGLRNIYIYSSESFTLFSTRLDWIKKLIPDTEIDWKKFGSRWLAINQFSNDSFLSGVNRLSQEGYACIKDQGLKSLKSGGVLMRLKHHLRFSKRP
mgnify:CR=1 FL=1